MQFCISITNKQALEKWLNIPKQQRSKFIEQSLLSTSNLSEIKALLYQLITEHKNEVQIDISLIDDILNL